MAATTESVSAHDTTQGDRPLRCRLCGATRISFVTAVDEFSIYRCLGCSVLFRVTGEPESSIEQSELNSDGNEQVWSEYERLYRPSRSRTYAKVLSNLPNGEGRRLLDIGSALGWFMQAAAENGYETWGVEPERAVADVGARRTQRPVFVGRFEECTYDSEFFDVVAMFDVLEHVIDPGENLAKIHLILRPGGYLVVRVPDLDGLLPRAVHLADRLSGRRVNKGVHLLWQFHRWGFNRRSLEVLFALNGFSVVNQYGEHANDVSVLKEKSWAGNPFLVRSVGGVIRVAGALNLYDERVIIVRRVAREHAAASPLGDGSGSHALAESR